MAGAGAMRHLLRFFLIQVVLMCSVSAQPVDGGPIVEASQMAVKAAEQCAMDDNCRDVAASSLKTLWGMLGGTIQKSVQGWFSENPQPDTKASDKFCVTFESSYAAVGAPQCKCLLQTYPPLPDQTPLEQTLDCWKDSDPENYKTFVYGETTSPTQSPADDASGDARTSHAEAAKASLIKMGQDIGLFAPTADMTAPYYIEVQAASKVVDLDRQASDQLALLKTAGDHDYFTYDCQLLFQMLLCAKYFPQCLLFRGEQSNQKDEHCSKLDAYLNNCFTSFKAFTAGDKDFDAEKEYNELLKAIGASSDDDSKDGICSSSQKSAVAQHLFVALLPMLTSALMLRHSGNC